MMSEERRTDEGRGYWVLARERDDDLAVMTIPDVSRVIFPVFSFREEAELFLWLSDLAGGWAVQSASSADLIGLLLGEYSTTDDVALDPLPEAQSRPLIDLVTVSRLRFVAVLLGRDPDSLSSLSL